MRLFIDKEDAALAAAIVHWIDIRDKPGCSHDHTSSKCALCAVRARCSGCQVNSATGYPGCLGTPYVAYRDYMLKAKKWYVPRFIWEWRRRRLATNEIEFLGSLRRVD